MYFPKISVEELAHRIDNTLLRPDATLKDIEKFCLNSLKYNFIGICVSSCYVGYVSKILKNSGIKVISTVGFPLGNISMEAKIRETEKAIRDGADEIDMVMNIGMFKSGRYDYIHSEIESILKIVQHNDKILKVIIETALLSDDEIAIATKMLGEIGVDYIKSNTGFIGKANIHDVMIIKENLMNGLKIKVAGGIRHYEEALLYIGLGVDRIGTSTGINIIEEYKKHLSNIRMNKSLSEQ